MTPAKPRAAHVRRIDLVAINDRLASLIIVFREGAVRQVLVTLPDAVEQEDLTRAAVVLDGIMAGRSATDADRALARIDATGADRLARRSSSGSGSCARSATTTRARSRTSSATACSTSWTRRSSTGARSCGGSSRRSRTAPTSAGLFDSIAATGEVQTFIGSENGPEEMRDVSLVLASYGEPSRAVGVVGVLGPTRMAYAQAIGTVRFVSGLMNELVAHIHA